MKTCKCCGGSLIVPEPQLPGANPSQYCTDCINAFRAEWGLDSLQKVLGLASSSETFHDEVNGEYGTYPPGRVS